MSDKKRGGGARKCLIWDLDHTVWDGILAEGDDVKLRPGVLETVRALDQRGILQSVASKNDHAHALGKLRELGLAEYFLAPQIHWGSKAESVRAIATALNIGVDALAFVDDQPFERDEVAFSLPEVLCLDAADIAALLALPALTPRFVTEDASRRRQMYLEDGVRADAEARFDGPKDEFLAGLDLRFTVGRAQASDLQRVEELTLRTNQLNATGYTYSYEELDQLRVSDDHLLLVAGLDDRYGSYGKIGVALVERGATAWTLKLLLMSCRVMSRGVGTVMLAYVMREARRAGVTLIAEFVPTDRNRQLYVLYRFTGFEERETRGNLTLLEHALAEPVEYPAYVTVVDA
ncbi:MAG TPA: HAD-IIIC family phosphatase [Kofleriaceae bacterium]|nr:HAD-IIIC family phosphatase [Kofleriaceae bacterium]